MVAVLALAPAALAACGGGDSSSQDEDDITASITTVATKDDPSTCTELQTEKFVKQTSDTLEDCKKDPSAEADSVEVSNVEVDGDTATADTAFTGGFVDGQTLSIALVKDGDTWKLDNLNGFSDFDRDAFVSNFEQQISSSGPDAAPPQAQACLKQQIAKATDEQLQGILLGDGSADQIFNACFGGE
jgi:hypothetical protein